MGEAAFLPLLGSTRQDNREIQEIEGASWGQSLSRCTRERDVPIELRHIDYHSEAYRMYSKLLARASNKDYKVIGVVNAFPVTENT